MRILDVEKTKPLKNICVYLTLDEAKEMSDCLKYLLANHEKTGQHGHVNDLTYEHEITLAIYDANRLEGFNETSIKLIRDEL